MLSGQHLAAYWLLVQVLILASAEHDTMKGTFVPTSNNKTYWSELLMWRKVEHILNKNE